jgi:hypothetical protein
MRAAALLLPALFSAMAAGAADIDMNDPRRALGREDDVRIDANLQQEIVTSGSPLAVTYRIENLTPAPVAVAMKSTDVSYDPETQTITVGIGSEIPKDGNMPQLATIGPGEKKTFTAAVTPLIPASAATSRFMPGPRYVQVKVSILRDLAPFAALIVRQSQSAKAVAQPLTDEQFDLWLKGNDTIFLNTIPVRYQPRARSTVDVESRTARMF